MNTRYTIFPYESLELFVTGLCHREWYYNIYDGLIHVHSCIACTNEDSEKLTIKELFRIKFSYRGNSCMYMVGESLSEISKYDSNISLIYKIPDTVIKIELEFGIGDKDNNILSEYVVEIEEFRLWEMLSILNREGYINVVENCGCEV